MSKKARVRFQRLSYPLAILLGLILFAVAAQRVSAAGTIFVTPDGSGSGGSWGDPASLQSALITATAGDEIWVEAGVYTPGLTISDTFTISAGVAIYGGFAGGEGSLNERDFENNVTVLSGDIDNNDTGKDAHGVVADTANLTGANSLSVVTADGTTTHITGTTRLDGFTITAGYAVTGTVGGGFYCGGDSGGVCDPHLENIIFRGNLAIDAGGAMYNNGHGGYSNPTLSNVSFLNNTALGGVGAGGAMFNDGGAGGHSNPTLINVTFTNNSAINGGAMFNNGQDDGDSSPTLENVTFTANSVSGEKVSGGAMMNNGYQGTSSPILNHVTFTGNSATGSGPYPSASGGAMTNQGIVGVSSPALNHVTFTGNSVTGIGARGGAIFNGAAGPNYFGPVQLTNSDLHLTDVTFSNNTASGDGAMGGALTIFADFQGMNTSWLRDVTFSGNTTNDNSAIGGALSIFADGEGSNSASLENVIFTNNSSAGGGGAIAFYTTSNYSVLTVKNGTFLSNSAISGGAFYSASDPGSVSTSLQNVTFVNNSATANGGAIYSRTDDGGESDLDLVNVILWGNSADSHGAQIYSNQSYPGLTTSLIQGGINGPGVFNFPGIPANDNGGNLQADPLFVDADAGNLHLSFGSPAIDTGSNIEGSDLDSNPRQLDGDGDSVATTDMGAFEAATVPTYTMSLTLAGNGSGQVSSAPVRLPCSASCTLIFAQGAGVTLNVTPTTGSTFTGWSGAGCSGTASCTLTMSSHKNLTATFVKSLYALTLNTTSGGTVSKSPDQATYLHGTVVTLTPHPNSGFTFTGWSGACTGTGACTVTMTSVKTVGATFIQNGQSSFALTISTTSGGTVSKAPDQATYISGTVVALTPHPNSGFTFSGWSGACTGTGACSVTMSSAKSVTATFTPHDNLGNDAPSFASTAGLSSTVGANYTYAVIAVDPDSGDTLTLSAPTKPTWLTLTPTGNGTATLTGTPTAANVGANAVQLRVQDAAGLFDIQSFSITVAAVDPITTGSVKGVVLDDKGKGVAGATVTLTPADSQLAAADVLTKLTDKNGGYQFDGVPLGDYTLTVMIDGKAPSAPISVTVKAGTTATAPSVTLTEPQQSGKALLHLPLLGRGQ